MSSNLAHICDVCHQPLSYHTASAGGSRESWWEHSHVDALVNLRDDHKPQPVPVVEMPETLIVGVCDFCSGIDPPWAYRVADFDALRSEDGKTVYSSVADWAACDRCADLIDAEDWDGLHEWVVSGATLGERLPELVHEPVAMIQASFRANYKPGRLPAEEGL